MKRAVLLVTIVGVTLLLASGIALAVTTVRCTDGSCKGTNGPDDMYGTRGGDVLYGRGGFDVVLAGARGDVISGGSGPDGMYDEEGNDTVHAGGGDDRVNFAFESAPGSIFTLDKVLFPGFGVDPDAQGNDVVFGGDGNDHLAGFGGTDVVYGGRGRDHIDAYDKERDVLYCGGGKDTAYYNKGVDRVFDCEVEHALPGDPPVFGEGDGFIRLR